MLVMCPAGQHLGDHVVERSKHLVAAGFQQRAVKDLVRQQVGLEVAGPTVNHHVRHRRRHDPALVRIGPAGGQRRGGGLEAAPQLGERHQKRCAVVGFEPPADHPRIEDVPLVGRLDRDADPAAGRDHAHRLEHPDRFPGDAAGDAVFGADAVEGEHLARRVLPGRRCRCRARSADCGARRRRLTGAATYTSCHSVCWTSLRTYLSVTELAIV